MGLSKFFDVKAIKEEAFDCAGTVLVFVEDVAAEAREWLETKYDETVERDSTEV